MRYTLCDGHTQSNFINCLIHLISTQKEIKVHLYIFYTKHEKEWKEREVYRYVNDTKKGSCICVTALFYRFTNYNKNTPKDDFGQKLPKVDMKGGGGGGSRQEMDYPFGLWLCHEQSLTIVFSRHARGFLLFWNYLSVLCDFIYCVSTGCGTSRGNNLLVL